MRKLAIGFGIGVLLIACTWGARAVLDGTSGSPAGTSGSPAIASGTGAPTEAAEATPPPGQEPEVTAEKVGLIDETTSPVQVLVSLLVVVAVMVGVLWGISRLMRRARLAPGRDRVLDLVDALSLGGKRQVYVVSYKDRTLLLGCGNEDIHLLAEYASDEFDAAPAEDRTKEPAPAVETASREDQVEISAAARARHLPSGAHRVPAAFRHLLEKSMDAQEGSGR